MINRNSIPNERIGAGYALNGMKASLIQLIEMMNNEHELTLNQINSWAWNQIEEINEELKG